MPHYSFLPGRGERALIVGQTGSGKTAFSVWMMRRIPIAPIIIYDTKDEAKFKRLPESKVVTTTEEILKATKDETIDYIVVRPPDEMLGEPQELDNYLWFHYMALHNTVCFIDELDEFHNNGRAYKGLIALLSRGRSRGITTIMGTQRPSNISRKCITEAQKVYVFRLGDRQDRKRLADVIPDFDDYRLPPKHGFYYFESGEDNPTLFKPVKLDRSMDTGYTDIQPEAEPGAPINQSPAERHIWI